MTPHVSLYHVEGGCNNDVTVQNNVFIFYFLF